MTDVEFENYLREYRTKGVGELLYNLICNGVTQVVGNYPPQVYSPNQVWDDDARTALCHDFIIERLLQAGWLEYHLHSQEDVKGLRRAIERNFRYFLINRKARSEYINLYGRVKKILNEDARFAKHPNNSTHARFWGLKSWKDKLIAQTRDEVLEAMFGIALPVLIRYRTDSKKYSPLLSNRDLTRLIEGTLRRLEKYVGMDLLMDCLRYRLNLLDAEIVSVDQPIEMKDDGTMITVGDTIPDSTDIPIEVGSEDLADDFYERLSNRQRAILALQSVGERPTLAEIGERIHVSKSTVKNELDTIGLMLAQSSLSQEEVERVFVHLSEKCLSYLEQNRNVDDGRSV